MPVFVLQQNTEFIVGLLRVIYALWDVHANVLRKQQEFTSVYILFKI